MKSGILSILIIVTLASCDKDKLDTVYDYSREDYVKSSIRIVNLVSYQQVIANGDTLTNPLANGVTTRYFQKTGILTGQWWIPQSLFDQQGNTDVEITGTIMGVSGGPSYRPQARFSLSNQDNRAMDYYTMNPGGGNGQPWIVPVERDETPPSKPDHFKIRILNLTKQVDPLVVLSVTGQLENLVGPVTLTYADGTPVSSKTTDVSIGQRVTEYIEVPYGTYQFRVLTADGRQISSTTMSEDIGITTTDPGTSSIPTPILEGSLPTYLVRTPINTFQPGGVYTIVVAPFQINYNVGIYPYYAYQNQFKIIQDVPPPVNQEYGRLQVINAIPGTTVSFNVNGEAIGSGLSFSEFSDYQIINKGTYHLQAQGRVGNISLDLEHTMEAGHNQTVWLWKNSDGEAQLTVQHNDLSGVATTSTVAPGTPGGVEDDASLSRDNPDMMIGLRFVNFSTNEPYVSFTFQNGQDPRNMEGYIDVGTANNYKIVHGDDARYQLQPGVVPNDRPMVWLLNAGYFEVMAYRSEPGIKPGEWIRTVPVRTSWELIANPLLYWQTGRPAPNMEAGVFTVALMGNTSEGVSESEKARMIIVKHNK